MAALILPSRRVVQPQGPVEIDWGNPITRGLVLAISPAAGITNLVGKGALVASRANAVAATGSGFSSSAGEAEYAATANIANGITLFTIMRARAGGYLFDDAERNILSSRNASNQGWSWYRVAAASGGSFGNVTKQGFTIQGVAGYSEANQTIPSDLDTPVAVRYNKATGAISWFANGVKSSADTSASTAALTGGALNYRQQGPFANNFGRYLDLLNNTLAFERMLSDAEIADLCANSWQVYRPIQRRIWVPVAGAGNTYTFTVSGGVSLTGTATEIKENVVFPSGGVVLAGTAPITLTGASSIYTFAVSGGVSLAGISQYNREKQTIPTGGITFSGNNLLRVTKAFTPSGGLILSGTSVDNYTRVLGTSGGITFGGTSPLINPANAVTTTYRTMTGMGQ